MNLKVTSFRVSFAAEYIMSKQLRSIVINVDWLPVMLFLLSMRNTQCRKKLKAQVCLNLYCS